MNLNESNFNCAALIAGILPTTLDTDGTSSARALSGLITTHSIPKFLASVKLFASFAKLS